MGANRKIPPIYHGLARPRPGGPWPSGIGEQSLIAITDQSPAGGEDLHRRTTSLLLNVAAGVRYRMIPTADLVGVLQALRTSACRLIVLNRDAARHPDEALQGILENLDCTVVLVP